MKAKNAETFAKRVQETKTCRYETHNMQRILFWKFLHINRGISSEKQRKLMSDWCEEITRMFYFFKTKFVIQKKKKKKKSNSDPNADAVIYKKLQHNNVIKMQEELKLNIVLEAVSQRCFQTQPPKNLQKTKERKNLLCRAKTERSQAVCLAIYKNDSPSETLHRKQQEF